MKSFVNSACITVFRAVLLCAVCSCKNNTHDLPMRMSYPRLHVKTLSNEKEIHFILLTSLKTWAWLINRGPSQATTLELTSRAACPQRRHKQQSSCVGAIGAHHQRCRCCCCSSYTSSEKSFKTWCITLTMPCCENCWGVFFFFFLEYRLKDAP